MTRVSRPEKRHRIGKIGLLVLSLVLSLVLAELIVAAFVERRELTSAWRFRAPRVLNSSVISIDSWFLEPSFYASYGQADEPLIVALGDSFTGGYNVSNCRDPREVCELDLSYPGVMREVLAEKGMRARVMNVGVGDTGPGQQLRLFEEYILPEVRPSIVVWQFYANDLAGNVIMPVYTTVEGRLQALDASQNWLYRRQRLFEAIPLPRLVKALSGLVNLAMVQFERQQMESVPDAHQSDVMGWGLEKLRLQVARMKQLAEEHGFKLYIILIAPQSVYLAESEPAHWAEFWEAKDYERIRIALAEEERLLVMRFHEDDLPGPPGEGGSSLATLIFSDEEEDSAPMGTRHLNARGYALVTRQITERILQDGALP